VDARGRELVDISAIEWQAIGRDQPCPQRVLLRTDAWPDSRTFPAKIPVISLATIGRLAEAGVQVLGVDLPSVDPLDCSLLANHHALHRAGMMILEGLDLTQVAPGHYDMLALPMLIPGADGTPVRALLRRSVP
jgi:arylformamidase